MVPNKCKLLFFIFLVAAYPMYSSKFSRKLPISRALLQKSLSFSLCFILSHGLQANAGMLTFPLPAPLKNNFAFARSGECYADAAHVTQTNPVKKLRQDNALTFEGREQAVEAARKLNEMNFVPSFIWVSNTERAYETAAIIAKEVQLGQNRIIPEYSFLDARSVGIYEGQDVFKTWNEIHEKDETEGINYRPPKNTDGTPTESVADVLVRGNQLISTVESMYSGENVLIVAPDSDNLSVLTTALISENIDEALPKHAVYGFKNGEVRRIEPLVKPPETLYTGQTSEEASVTSRKMKAIRLAGSTKNVKDTPDSWMDLWHISVDNS